MRHEPRRWSRIIRVVLSALVVGTIVVLVEGVAPGIRAQSPPCRSGIQQAESGMLVGFTTEPDPSASGGSFIHVPEGNANRWTPSEAYRASYCFIVETPGRYRLAATVWADGGTSDSFFVAVNGGMVGTGRWDVLHTTSYGRDHVNSYQAADPVEVDLAAGDQFVDVYLREDGTRLDTIALERLDVSARCPSGWVGAEDGLLEGFSIVTDRNAHANRAIEVAEGAGSSWYASASHRARYCLNAAADGVYRIEADVHSPSTTSDSFFVRVDGGDIYTWYSVVGAGYVRDVVNSHGVVDPLELELAAGAHTVEIFLREDGTRLDRLRLSEKPAPMRRDCRQDRYEAEDVAIAGFQVGADAGASGGRFIHIPDGAGSAWAPSDATSATFCFDIRQAGAYRIAAGVWADNGTNDSFWLRLDGSVARRWDVEWTTEYASDVIGFRGEDPFTVDLARGQHVIEVLLREDGTRLDWLGIERVDGS